MIPNFLPKSIGRQELAAYNIAETEYGCCAHDLDKKGRRVVSLLRGGRIKAFGLVSSCAVGFTSPLKRVFT